MYKKTTTTTTITNKIININNLTLHCMCFNGKYSAFIIKLKIK